MTDEDWRASVSRRLSTLEKRQADTDRELSEVKTKNAVGEVHRNNVETRLTKIESSLTWLVRLVIGAILLALIGFVMNGGLSK